MKRNQLGKFWINVLDIGDNLNTIAKLMQGMIVVSARFDFGAMAIEYIAISPYFKEVSTEDWEIGNYPLYRVIQDGNEFYLIDENEQRL